MSYPDHNTINRFRSDRLRGVLKEVFSQVVLLLVDHGYITLKEAYLDGTKIEANANRYTFVWGRTIKYNRGRIRNQLKELWSYAEQVAKEELEHNEPDHFEEIDAEKVSHAIEQIDKALVGKEVDKKVKQKLNYAKRKWPAPWINMKTMSGSWVQETVYQEQILMPPLCGFKRITCLMANSNQDITGK